MEYFTHLNDMFSPQMSTPSQVYTAAMTLFSQIVAGDAWGDMSLPLLETQPWTSVILFATGNASAGGVFRYPRDEGPKPLVKMIHMEQ